MSQAQTAQRDKKGSGTGKINLLSIQQPHHLTDLLLAQRRRETDIPVRIVAASTGVAASGACGRAAFRASPCFLVLPARSSRFGDE